MNFWEVHTIFFIFFLLICPRLTMLFMGICFFPFPHPILFFFGWLLCPRLVIAILATSNYWNTNPVLCILAWIAALGTVSENKKDAQIIKKLKGN